MHETALASSLIRVVLEEAKKHEQGRRLRITGVTLEIGLLSCVEAQTLRGCFELLAEGTAAEKACLDIRLCPLAGRCAACGALVSVRIRNFACPLCLSREVDWQGGHEMDIIALNVTPLETQTNSVV